MREIPARELPVTFVIAAMPARSLSVDASEGRAGLALGLALLLGWTIAPAARAAPPPVEALRPTPTAAVPVAAPARALTLTETVERAIAVAPGLEKLRAAVDQADADVRVVGSSYLPKVDLLGIAGYTAVGGTLAVVGGLNLFSTYLSNTGSGGFDAQNLLGNVGLALRYDLVDFGRASRQSAVELLRDSNRAALAEQERQVRFAATAAYRQLQLSEALIPVWEDALAASTRLRENVSRMLARGLVARLDLLRTEAMQANDRQGLVRAQVGRDAAQARLVNLLALTPTDRLRAADPIRAAGPWPYPLERTLALALEERPLLQTLERLQQSQDRQAEAAIATLYPSVQVLAGGGITGGLITGTAGQSGTTGTPLGAVTLGSSAGGQASGSFYDAGALLLVRQPLYDGGMAASLADGARARSRGLSADLTQARRQITQDVTDNWHQLQAQQASVSAAEAALKANERAYRDAQLRYRANVSDYLELMLARRDLTAAQAGLYEAITTTNLALDNLQRETGQDSLPRVGPPNPVSPPHGLAGPRPPGQTGERSPGASP